MSKARLRAELTDVRRMEGHAPSFSSVLAPRARSRGRLRLGRAAVAACCIVGAVVIMIPVRPERSPDVASLALPPTTDWLLQTPSAHLLTQTPNTENPDAAGYAPH